VQPWWFNSPRHAGLRVKSERAGSKERAGLVKGSGCSVKSNRPPLGRLHAGAGAKSRMDSSAILTPSELLCCGAKLPRLLFQALTPCLTNQALGTSTLVEPIIPSSVEVGSPSPFLVSPMAVRADRMWPGDREDTPADMLHPRGPPACLHARPGLQLRAGRACASSYGSPRGAVNHNPVKRSTSASGSPRGRTDGVAKCLSPSSVKMQTFQRPPEMRRHSVPELEDEMQAACAFAAVESRRMAERYPPPYDAEASCASDNWWMSSFEKQPPAVLSPSGMTSLGLTNRGMMKAPDHGNGDTPRINDLECEESQTYPCTASPLLADSIADVPSSSITSSKNKTVRFRDAVSFEDHEGSRLPQAVSSITARKEPASSPQAFPSGSSDNMILWHLLPGSH